MFRNAVLWALASAAIIPAAAAHPGGGGGPPAGVGSSGNAGGLGGGLGNLGVGGGFGAMNGIGQTMRDQGRLNSQGPANASATGIAHADQNSVLSGTTATTTVTSGALSGLTTGTTLYSNGTAVGTVQQIRTTGHGSVAVLIIKGTNGGFYAVPASKLTLSGGALSTTARLAGINTSTSTNTAMSNQARMNSMGPMHASATGLAHANRHSVLYGAPTTTSTSVATSSQWRANSQGPTHASATGNAHASSHSVLYGATANSTSKGGRRLNSQGPTYASATGIAHANSHSVLSGASVSTLSGVSVGMPLISNGAQVGTIYRIVTAKGMITRVFVQGTNGRIYSLAPRTLTSAGGSVTTSVALRGI